MSSTAPKPVGMRQNGKNWHENKKAFRPTAGLKSYAKRLQDRVNLANIKEREREMKEEKQAERDRHIQAIKERRAAKEEKERFEKMAEKMHHKRVERRKRKEKRNKLLNSYADRISRSDPPVIESADHQTSEPHLSSQENMDHSTPSRNSERPADSSSRLSSAKTFPVNLHHRHRSESRQTRDTSAQGSAPAERQHWSRRLFIDTSDLEPDKSKPVENNTVSHNNNERKHRHSKSRDHRIPRAVNQIASAGGARNLLPSRTFHRGDKEKPDAGDDNLLKPAATLDSSLRSAQSSRSTSAHNAESRQSSLAAATGGNVDLSKKLALANLREVKTMEDLDEVKRRREKGEESLRTKLSSVGSLAADITRRLDYTYYNLLERVSTLYSTIRTFQDLVDSSSTLQDDFERDNANLEQDFRKQLGEFKEFRPQIDRIDVLEKRMSAGRNKMEALGKRLDSVRQEIEGWERRENEWQARVSRRLRIFWAVIITATVFVVIAYVVQEWPNNIGQSSFSDGLLSHQPETSPSINGANAGIPSVLPELSEAEVESLIISPPPTKTATSTSESSQPVRNQYESSDRQADPLRLFDEL